MMKWIFLICVNKNTRCLYIIYNIVDIWTLCGVTKNNGYTNFVDYFVLFAHGYFVHISLFIDWGMYGCLGVYGCMGHTDIVLGGG